MRCAAAAEWTSLPMRSRQPSYESKMAYRQGLLDQIHQQQNHKQGALETARERELREAEERHQNAMEAEQMSAERLEKERILNEAKEAAAAHVQMVRPVV